MLAFALFFLSLVVWAIMEFATYDQRIACRKKEMDSMRDIFSTHVECVPRVIYPVEVRQ